MRVMSHCNDLSVDQTPTRCGVDVYVFIWFVVLARFYFWHCSFKCMTQFNLTSNPLVQIFLKKQEPSPVPSFLSLPRVHFHFYSFHPCCYCETFISCFTCWWSDTISTALRRRRGNTSNTVEGLGWQAWETSDESHQPSLDIITCCWCPVYANLIFLVNKFR